MTNYTVEDLRSMQAVLQAEAEAAKRLYEKRLRECRHLSGTIAVLERQEATVNEPLPAVGTIDFTGASNLVQRAERIAAHTEGVVNATKAAQLILDAGISKAKKRSLTSTLYRELSQSDDWERVSPGTFRWKAYGNSQSTSAALDAALIGQTELASRC